jgi:hypothetical protein
MEVEALRSFSNSRGKLKLYSHCGEPKYAADKRMIIWTVDDKRKISISERVSIGLTTTK